MQKKVAIITNGYFPVPAALGGAVEALDENLIVQNEVDNRINLVVFSCYNESAFQQSKSYKNTAFRFIKIPKIIQRMDRIIYFIAKDVLRKKKNMSYRYILQRLFYIQEVAKELQNNEFDKIVLENHATLFMALKKHKNYKKYAGRYYYHVHNVVTNGYGCDDIISNCKKIIGVSDYINKTVKDFLGEKDQNTYVVLRNKINQEKFCTKYSVQRKHEIREEFNLSDDDIVILFSGRLNPEKGIKELLEAFKMLDSSRAKLLIVGGYYFGSGMVSSFEKELHILVDELKDKVQFTGFVQYSKMPDLYAIADIAVVPSVWDDPAPLTVIESLTAGKALITTNSGGIPEYADTSSSIILDKNENLIKELKNSMKILVENPSLRREMEDKVHEKTKNWNLRTYYNDFCDIIEE